MYEENFEDDKLPPNAFILFMRAVRNTVPQDNLTDVNEDDIEPLIGKMWQMLDEETKNLYRAQAKEAYKKFKKEHPNYMEKKAPKNIEINEKKCEPMHIKVIFNDDNNSSATQLSDPLSLLKIPQKENNEF